MKNNLTEIVFIIDKSGSMSGLELDTIGGFNSIIKKERNGEGEAFVSTVFFNHENEVIHDRISIKDVKELTEDDYQVGGCTALIDAIGGAIKHIGNIHKYARKEDVPERTLFVITTDGMENSSRKYSATKVKQMIENQKEKYGWEFLFLGANIDAVETARHFGIDEEHTSNYMHDKRGTQMCYDSVAAAVDMARNRRKFNKSWKESVERDYNKRNK